MCVCVCVCVCVINLYDLCTCIGNTNHPFPLSTFILYASLRAASSRPSRRVFAARAVPLRLTDFHTFPPHLGQPVCCLFLAPSRLFSPYLSAASRDWIKATPGGGDGGGNNATWAVRRETSEEVCDCCMAYHFGRVSRLAGFAIAFTS